MELESEFWSKVEEQRSRAEFLVSKPVFNLILTANEFVAPNSAARTFSSLLSQSYSDWRAYLVGTQAEFSGWNIPDDPRMFRLLVSESTPASDRKNLALDKISDGWVGLVDVGDVLSPAALFRLASEMDRSPNPDAFYSHEVEWLDRKQVLGDFISKGFADAWALAHSNSVGRFWVARKQSLRSFSKLPHGWDEHLALLDLACRNRLCLVPWFLYYRQSKAAPAPSAEVWKGEVDRTLQSHGFACVTEVAENRRASLLRVTPGDGSERPFISAVVCFRNKAKMTCEAIRSLLAAQGKVPLEIVLVDNDSSEGELAVVRTLVAEISTPVKVVQYSGPFNYGRMHNRVIREHCRGNLILFLNNDVILQNGNLDYWAAWAALPEVASAGVLLRFGHGGVQHAGIRGWFGGNARMAKVGNSHESGPAAHTVRQVFANTFAACMVKKAAFDAVGGLREIDLANGFGDVAFCFEALRKGWKHFYLGTLSGVHAESSSRGRPYEYWEEVGIERDYPDILQRLLREDAGRNRVPATEDSFRGALTGVALAKFRKNSKLLDPFKPTLKKWLRNISIQSEDA